MKQRRVQRSRKAGSRLPAGTVCCTRGTPLGNPFVGPEALGAYKQMGLVMVNAAMRGFRKVTVRQVLLESGWHVGIALDVPGASAPFRGYIAAPVYSPSDFLIALRKATEAKHLACYCPLDQPCHVDVLIDVLIPLIRESVT